MIHENEIIKKMLIGSTFSLSNPLFKLHTLNSSIVCCDRYVNQNYYQTKVSKHNLKICLMLSRCCFEKILFRKKGSKKQKDMQDVCACFG